MSAVSGGRHACNKPESIIIIIIIFCMSGEPRAQRAIGHTQVRLQPEPGADMHRLAALSTRKCTLAAYRSTPPSYTNAEGPSLANRSKLRDGFRQRRCGCLRSGRIAECTRKSIRKKSQCFSWGSNLRPWRRYRFIYPLAVACLAAGVQHRQKGRASALTSWTADAMCASCS